MAANKALFLDRDGVINSDTGYAHEWATMTIVPGIIEIIRHFKDAGYLIVIVTNQSGIGRGYYSEDDFKVVMTEMCGYLAGHGAAVDAYYWCSCDPTVTSCRNRKPNPGMLISASADLDISLSRSVLIGDKRSDIDAGSRAGLKQLYFLSDDEICYAATLSVRHLSDLLIFLMSKSGVD